MIRAICLLLFAGFLLWPAQAAPVIKLYLKDGSYQIAREYKVESDRVRYYSTDRSEWEEIPLELVDLKKTESEIHQREEANREEAKVLREEEKAEREVAQESTRVPADPGVYFVQGDKIQPIKAADSKVVNNKGRNALKMLSPIPAITGKATLELDGARSSNVFTNPRPEFYFRLASDERFGMVRMGLHKGNRVVEKITIIPVVKEMAEEPDLVETFRQQLAEGLYKIWPTQPLEAGEYAVVEYTEGKVNMQVWDFAYRPATP